ncbi:MAG: DNA repair protein RecN, partial [Anaerolineales bacterium]|nr:DNA repair protein RecN [Anaerolineales bacterium]
FTGETGAGKSIIIDAMETLLGGRAEVTQVRSGSERALISAVFQLDPDTQSELIQLLEEQDLVDARQPELLVLSREIRANGRSPARVNGANANTSLLRQIGEYLVDVHGQSEHLSLLRVSQHLGLLDNYLVTLQGAAAEEQLRAYRETYQSLQAIKKELEALQQAEREAVRRSDILNYQIKEIEAARLHPGDEEALREERNRLANAEGLASAAQEAIQAIDEGTPESPAAADLIGHAAHAISALVRLDPSQSALFEQAETLSASLADLSASLHDYLEGIEFNPRRLDQVEERLGLIQTLKRKYGDTIPAVLEFAGRARVELDEITHAAERIQELSADQEIQLKKLGQHGLALSQMRRAAAEKLGKAIERELADLHMPGARFQVDFQQSADPQGAPLPDGQRLAYRASGLEKVEFLIAPNPGEGFKPLAKIASGGETSRLMLAIKNVLAKADHIPTLIFDEIDQGIGGRVGAIVGEKLWELARQHQVLCITHLPQLAVFGEQHLHVQKAVSDGRTATQVQQLEGEARLQELAQMLGGVSPGTLHSARDLLEMVETITH